MNHLKPLLFSLYSIIFLVLCCSTAMGQSILGTWQNADYGITLVLHQNYSYQLYNSQGALTEQGQFSVNQQNLMLQSAQTGYVNTYTVTGFGESYLNCVDVNSNISFNFTRADAAQQNYGQSAPPSTAVPPISGQVLATQNGLSLNQGHAEVYVKFMEFVLGTQLGYPEKDAIKNDLIKSFNSNPSYELKEAETLHSSMQQLYQLTDITKINAGRLTFIAEFHKNWSVVKNTIFGQLIEKYSPVETVDPQSGLALTRNDLVGFVEFMDFMNSEIGGNAAMAEHDKTAYRQKILQEFPTMNQDQKASICMGNLLNTMMRENWLTMDAAQQAQARQQFASQLPQTSAPVPSSTQSSNSGSSNWDDPELDALQKKLDAGTITQKEALRYQQKMQNRQNMYNMLSNMSLQNHVSTMNVIENIGGTGNYWEVVNY